MSRSVYGSHHYDYCYAHFSINARFHANPQIMSPFSLSHALGLILEQLCDKNPKENRKIHFKDPPEL